MIHGGTEYDCAPTEDLRKMTAAARSAGATLVINHHPHVVGGFDWNGHSLVAWSMGNFLFDQKLRPTFESFLLTVHLRRGRVVQAYAEPILIQDYVPHGLTGDLAEWVARRAAGRQNGFTFIEDGAMVVDVNGVAAGPEKEVEASSGVFPVPDGWQAIGFRGQGTALPGEDLLWTGDFESDAVPSTHAPLWEMDNGVTITTQAAHAGRWGAKFRVNREAKTAFLTQAGRIPVQPGNRLTLTGMARGSGLCAIARFFPDNKQASSSESAQALPLEPAGRWTNFAVDLTVPSKATAMQLVVKLEGSNKPAQADLGEIRLIHWEKAPAPFGMRTGFLRLSSPGKVLLRATHLPGSRTFKRS